MAGVVEASRQLVFVGAEAGGGKTRFVVEAALALHAEGRGIVWGACSQDMGMAHDPFVEPLVTLLGALVPGDRCGPGAARGDPRPCCAP